MYKKMKHKYILRVPAIVDYEVEAENIEEARARLRHPSFNASLNQVKAAIDHDNFYSITIDKKEVERFVKIETGELIDVHKDYKNIDFGI